MAGMLETPSRVWRRIEAGEGQDMPSLPSLPAFEDSADQVSELNDESNVLQEPLPLHSTPAALSSHTMSTVRPPSSAASTARFANSLASRSSKTASISRGSLAKQPQEREDTFDISSIPSLPDMNPGIDMDIRSSDQDSTGSSVSEAYVSAFAARIGEEVDVDLDISEALRSVSRPGSPESLGAPTPQKRYDYSVSLRSEKKPSPFDKLRNVSLRRPLSRTRTPSLTRTTPSPSSSSSHSTPHSSRSFGYPRSATASPLAALSVPLPPSAAASPAGVEVTQDNSAAQVDEAEMTQSEEGQSRDEMDLTDTLSRGIEISDPGEEGRKEPTFSSDAPTQSEHEEETRDPIALSTVFSSPAPSAMFTPTPAFHSRPRARFATALPLYTPEPQQLPHAEKYHEEYETEAGQDQDGSDPTTPYAHKRSFLLSVINSTARPRLKYPTPHPHRGGDVSQVRAPTTPGMNLQAAFAGVTPRPQPRPRLSHPLTQAWPAASQAESVSSSEATSESMSPAPPHSPIPSGAQSPYDATMDRASFVSTASSHDLTTHVRANASFDPVMGLGERGHGVGRFNAGKLNSYLHGLNRRLQEENETLVSRLRTYEEKYGKNANAEPSTTPETSQHNQQSRRRSSGRRVSAGPGIGLNDVAEEGWVEEKAALEEMIEELKQDLQQRTEDKEKAEEALSREKHERTRDKDRWRERMTEVEKGVSGIIQDLEEKLVKAEGAAIAAEQHKNAAIRDAERHLATTLAEKDMFEERAKKAEAALQSSGQELASELNAMSERVAQMTGELRNATGQIQELEQEVMRADEKIDDLDKQLHQEKNLKAELEEEVHAKNAELEEVFQHVRKSDEDLRKASQELQHSKAHAAQMEANAAQAVRQIESLESQLSAADDKLMAATDALDRERQEVEHHAEEANRASELARQMEEALEAAETRMIADEQDIASLKTKITALERAVEREREQSRSKDDTHRDEAVAELQADIEALETELDQAHKEIARLNVFVNQSPVRKAVDKAKDAKIEMLEKEREDLLDRVRSLKTQNSMFATPNKTANGSGISPMHRHLLSMRSPKTPGGPLRDLSWLQSTMNDPTVSPLVVEIARLQQELDRANESIDDKLDQLEDAGLGVVELTKRLEDARDHIAALEDEIARLMRRDERRYHRLQRVRCLKCRAKVDLRGLQRTDIGDESSILEEGDSSLPTEPPTPPTRTSEALRADLQKVNAQLSSMKKAWEEETRRLLGENVVLQDAATRLNAQVRDAQNEARRLAETERAGEKARVGIQGELDQAKRNIDELEAELKAERMQLRTLSATQNRAQREKEEVILQLHRAESDMADVREHLQRLKQENHELESELRSNTTAEQKARRLESKVAENAQTMEQLRQERSVLAADFKQLQTRYAEVSKHVSKLRDEHAASQTSHDERRHQLDLRLLEIEDLRRALSEKADELHRVESEKTRATAEKTDIARTVETLEADLRRVRKDADTFGRDLKLLRAQKDRLEEERKHDNVKAERAQKQSQSQIRLLKEQLESQREQAKTTAERHKSQVYAVNEELLADIKLQHKKECKGLMVQIRFLKARFTREEGLRTCLVEQKRYLLVLLARSERKEQKILAAIAQIGFPSAEPPSPPKRHSLKSVALSVVFTLRAKHVSDAWRVQSAVKADIAAAYQEARRKKLNDGGKNGQQ